MSDGSKATNDATSNAASNSTDKSGAKTNDQAPALTITTAADISAQVEKLRRATTKDSTGGRAFTLSGFKHLGGLDGMDTAVLAVMAGAMVRQIALNGKGSKQAIDALRSYSQSVQKDIETEGKLDSYLDVAKDLGITRGEDESAQAFIDRVLAAFKAKK